MTYRPATLTGQNPTTTQIVPGQNPATDASRMGQNPTTMQQTVAQPNYQSYTYTQETPRQMRMADPTFGKLHAIKSALYHPYYRHAGYYPRYVYAPYHYDYPGYF